MSLQFKQKNIKEEIKTVVVSCKKQTNKQLLPVLILALPKFTHKQKQDYLCKSGQMLPPLSALKFQ